MSKAESPSSVSLEYNPEKHGVGTTTDRFQNYKFIEQGAHRRKAGNSQLPRVIHIVDTTGEEAVKTVRVAQEGEYSTIHIKNHTTETLQEVQVNGNHFRLNNGAEEGKYSFSGARISEEEAAFQLSLDGFVQMSLDYALDLKKAQPSPVETALPDVLEPSIMRLLLDTAKTVRDPKEQLEPETTLRLGTMFDELSSTSTS